MRIGTFWYCLKEGIKNIGKNIWFSLASMAIISACIFLFCIFFSLVANVQYMVRNVETTVGITVFFDEDLGEAEIKAIGDQIGKRPEVKEYSYVSPEEAWDSFKEDYFEGMEELAGAREIVARLKAQDSEGRYGRLELELDNVNEEDWSNAWKKYYHPVRVGERLVVCPSWEEYQPQQGDVMLTLNPGMAFGTGTHDTTRLCMELLEKYITPEDSVLDVGCGSGILAITAALLGAKEIKGCDIDEVAVKVAGENAALNKVADRIAFHKGDLTSQVEGSFQLICANIRLSRDVGKYLAQDGIFITSGIIDTREQDVQDALAANGFTVIERRTSGGWVALACKAK